MKYGIKTLLCLIVSGVFMLFLADTLFGSVANTTNTSLTFLLSGTVISENGKALADVNICVGKGKDFPVQEAQGVLCQTKTDSNGNFVISNIPAGLHPFFANKWGYETVRYVFSIYQDYNVGRLYLGRTCIADSVSNVELVIYRSEKRSNIPMKREPDTLQNRWSATVPLLEGDYRYAFRINGGSFLYPDLAAARYQYNGYGDFETIEAFTNKATVRFEFDPTLYWKEDKASESNNGFTYQSKYWLEKNLTYAADADDYLLDKVKKHKVVFLGESHHIVNPLLFLTRNIRKLYRKGHLRYLFLESGQLQYSPDIFSKNKLLSSYFSTYYPWELAGDRYEWIGLFKEIKSINDSAPKNEQLKVIYPEKGLDIRYATNFITDGMNIRDLFISSNIITAVSNSPEIDRTLILYGSAHGFKQPRLFNTGYSQNDGNMIFIQWKSMASLLSEEFKDSFFSINEYYDNDDGMLLSLIDHQTYYSHFSKDGYFGIDTKGSFYDWDVSLGTNGSGEKMPYSSCVDGTIFMGTLDIGLPIHMVKSKQVINFLVNWLKNYYRLINSKITLPEVALNAYQKRFVRSLYYLKFHIKDFPYNYWDTNVSLLDDIVWLEQWKTNLIKMKEDSDFSIKEKSSYCNYLSLGAINAEFDPLRSIDYLEKAGSYDYDRLFSDYYLVKAYKQINYTDKALQTGENLLTNESINNLEYLPDLMITLSDLYASQGNKGKAEEYLTRFKSLGHQKVIPYVKPENGVFVTSVDNESQADGFQFGDLILAYNGQKIYEIGDLEKHLVSNTFKSVSVDILRNKNLLNIRIKGGPVGIKGF
jgi:hypothetical protein